MAEKHDTSAEHLTFSQRHGYEPLPEPMRLEELSNDLRREIWNHVRGFLNVFRIQISISGYIFRDGEITGFIEYVLGKLLKIPEDEIKTDHDNAMSQFKEIIELAKFNKVLDLIELVANAEQFPVGFSGVNPTKSSDEFLIGRNKFVYFIKQEFNQQAAAYWLDTSTRPFQFYPRSSKEQGEATQQAIETLRQNGMEGATTHLRQAAACINERRFADSVKDSIHAVESVACVIAQKTNATLGEALDSLEKAGLLNHKALKQGFDKLYGYASDEQGIRHALLEKGTSDVDLDEAIFMFGACASFAAYLVNKHRQMKPQQDSGQ